MFEWNPEYSVGIASIDTQHKVLFLIGRDLYIAMSSRQGKEAIGGLLDRLVRYTKSHFAYEESLLEKSDYPAIRSHQMKHDAFTDRIVQFQADYADANIGLTPELLEFLRDWLVTHIQKEDVAYTPFLKGKAA
jgi:hemerythrin